MSGMSLLDDFGQPVIRRQWDTILAQDKLPHAILLYGEPGSGPLTGALSLANDIFCTSPVSGKACRQCAACHRAQKWIHPDLHFLVPLAGAKSITIDYLDTWKEAMKANPWLNVFQWTQFCDVEGKQVDIHKEDISNVTSTLALQSYEGGRKVLIIWMAQFLAREGNRLLKMIEEPFDDTFFILVTNQREQILPTIRSRCMQCFFPPMQEEAIAGILQTEMRLDPTAALRIAQQSGNDMNHALMLAQNSMLNFKDEMASWFRMMLGKKGNEIAGWSTRMGGQPKEEQKQFCLYTLSAVREILKEENNNNTPGREMIRYMHDHFHPEVWLHIMSLLQSTHEKIMRNANTKLLWLSMSIAIKNHLANYRLQHINS